MALRTFDESRAYVTAERRLMLAIIINALIDASGHSCGNRPEDRERDRAAAVAWFRDAGPDFQSVCHMAGLDPSNVRTAALRFVASGNRMPRRQGERSPRKPRAPRSMPIQKEAA